MNKKGKFKLYKMSAIGFITCLTLMTTSSQALNTNIGTINIKSPKLIDQNSITSGNTTKVACANNTLISINTKSSSNYKIAPGDTLYKVASKFNITVAELKKMNNLKSDILLVGQNITVVKEVTPVIPIKPVTPITPVAPVKPAEKVEPIKNDLSNKYSIELSDYSTLPYYDSTKESRYINYKISNQDISWEDVITYVNIGLDNKYYTNIIPVADPSNIKVLANKYNQLPSSYIPNDLEKISVKYSNNGMQLRHEARAAFEALCSDGAENKIKITAISTYRSYAKQDIVYWRYKGANETKDAYQSRRDRVSARPGHSEHQTGLSVDVNGLEEWVEDTVAFKWYSIHAHEYGFIIRYPKGKEHITGYSYEPWHLRYVGVELATAIYNSGLTYDEYYVRYLAPNVKTNTTINNFNTNFLQASDTKTLVKTIENKKRA